MTNTQIGFAIGALVLGVIAAVYDPRLQTVVYVAVLFLAGAWLLGLLR